MKKVWKIINYLIDNWEVIVRLVEDFKVILDDEENKKKRVNQLQENAKKFIQDGGL